MDNPEVRLRGYTPADLDAMFALDVECFDEPFRFSRRTMQQFAEAKKARVVIAELVGEVVGFAIAHVGRAAGSNVGYVMTLDVAEPLRRHRLATLLMQRLEEESREAGCDAMMLHVFEGNEAALRFYERAGYERFERAREFYGPGMDGWVYRKLLGATAVEGGARNEVPDRPRRG